MLTCSFECSWWYAAGCPRSRMLDVTLHLHLPPHRVDALLHAVQISFAPAPRYITECSLAPALASSRALSQLSAPSARGAPSAPGAPDAPGRTRRTRPHPAHPAQPGTPGATWTWSHGFKSLQKINPTIQKEIENLKKNNRKQIQKLKAQFTRRSTNKKQTNPKRSFFPKSAKQLDDGWPESVEEQSLLLLVWRHYITRQYIKDVF